ncbi:MAG TPA: biotin/lipoyl-binding protein, partial [Candidatus Paceibacterota bacterium]|nr:biotin/lipoyl-binding protein [Candidatus Paceibacterota bacterium]
MAIKINWKFLKSKKFIISLIVLAIVVGAWFFLTSSQKSKLPYETVKVERGNLTQTVEVTGNINATEDLSLNFQVPGVIAYVGVKEGNKVYAGQWLANLTLTELDAAVAQAQAVLDQKLAGATPEQINAAQKQIESAEIALNNARALANASLNSKYESALVSLDDVSVKMNNTLKTTRDLKIKYFTDTSQESIRYQNNLDLINNALLKFNGLLNLAKISRNQNDIDTTIDNALESLDIILVSLTSNRDILDIEPHKSKISEQEKASLDNQKSIISTAKITIAGVKNDIAISKSQNENNIKSAEAALNLQKANYDNLVAKPREVDIAYYRAALAQAEANRNKAIIYAPISGVITKVNKNKGETISS